MKSHHIYIIIFLVINLILITIEILAYTDVNPERFINKVNLKSFFNYILRIYHFIVLIFLLISIYIMNRSKKSLLKKIIVIQIESLKKFMMHILVKLFILLMFLVLN